MSITYETIINDKKYNEWYKYEPHDIQYMRYSQNNPSVIAAGFKVGDVYSAFAYAHASLEFSLKNNYGDLADAENSKILVKYMFIRDAIINYAICEDLSWQVVWAYIQPSDINYLMKDNYDNLAKECNRDNLFAQLDCAIAQHNNAEAGKLKNIVMEFDTGTDVQVFRTFYNYIKHRGDIQIEDLGGQDEHLMASWNGSAIELLKRDVYKLDDLREMAWHYNCKFENYFNKLIAEIFPQDYLDNKIDIFTSLKAVKRMHNAQNDK